MYFPQFCSRWTINYGPVCFPVVYSKRKTGGEFNYRVNRDAYLASISIHLKLKKKKLEASVNDAFALSTDQPSDFICEF